LATAWTLRHEPTPFISELVSLENPWKFKTGIGLRAFGDLAQEEMAIQLRRIEGKSW